MHPLTLQDWPLTGLPWAAFWLKELLTWGTLDPVAAFLLAKGLRVTRMESEETAQAYYRSLPADVEANEILNPSSVRKWADDMVNGEEPDEQSKPLRHIQAELLRDFGGTAQRQWPVLPVDQGTNLYWVDPAGFPLASSEKPKAWQAEYLEDYDFTLDTAKGSVSAKRYL